jgi:curved DNA-binding protein CbpA
VATDRRSKIPKIVPGTEVTSLPIGPMEGFVLSRIDGRADLEEIADLTGQTRGDVRGIVERLVQLGAVEWAEPESQRTSSPSAPPSQNSQPARDSQRPSSQGTDVVHTRPLPPGTSRTLYDPAELEEEGVELDLERRRRILDTYYRLSELNHYELLGIERTAEKAEVRRAYFSLSKIFHPDTLYGKKLGSYKSKMELVFRRLTEAYEVLGKKKKRAEYDQYLEVSDETRAARRRLEETRLQAEAIERGETEPRSDEASTRQRPASPQPAAPGSSPPSQGERIPAASPAPGSSPPPSEASQPPQSSPPRQSRPTQWSRPPQRSNPPQRSGPPPAPPQSTSSDRTAGSSSSPSSPPPSRDRRRELHAKRLTAAARRRTSSAGSVPPTARSTSPSSPSSSASSPSGSNHSTSSSNFSVRSGERQQTLRGLTSSLKQAASHTGGVGTVDRYLRDAKQAESGGDLLGATNALRLAAAMEPGREDVQREHGRLKRALAARMADTYRKQAEYEERLGEWKAAGLSWARVCEGCPDDAVAARRAARALLEAEGDLKRAKQFAQRAVELDPDNVFGRRVLGHIFLKAGMKLNARRELEAASKLDPSDEIVKNLLREAKR